MNTPLVSILVPAYNAAPWLADTLQSCLQQTWAHTEVIVVDDGSRDSTLAVARAFQSTRLKVVTQDNAGAPVARNRAYSLAQGDYIQWLDADDLLHPEKLARQIHAARTAADPLVLFSGAYGTFYRRPEKAHFVPTSLWQDLSPLDYLLIRFNENACFQTDAWLVSRELSEAAGPWSQVGSPDDDGEYFCRVAIRARRIQFVSNARSYYRQGVGGGLHNASSSSALRALFDTKVQCIRHLLSIEDSPRSRAAAVTLLRDWLPYFYPEHPQIVAEAFELATALGGTLSPPRLKWKYRPAEWMLGHRRATAISRKLPAIRSSLHCAWDDLLYRLSSRSAILRTTHEPLA